MAGEGERDFCRDHGVVVDECIAGASGKRDLIQEYGNVGENEEQRDDGNGSARLEVFKRYHSDEPSRVDRSGMI